MTVGKGDTAAGEGVIDEFGELDQVANVKKITMSQQSDQRLQGSNRPSITREIDCRTGWSAKCCDDYLTGGE